jgi:hypothetical protein
MQLQQMHMPPRPGFPPQQQQQPWFPGPHLPPRPPTALPQGLYGQDAAAAAPASVSVYVGKLPAAADAAYVLDVLKACGRLVNWNQATDADTGLPKAFGFASYKTAEEVSGLDFFNEI